MKRDGVQITDNQQGRKEPWVSVSGAKRSINSEIAFDLMMGIMGSKTTAKFEADFVRLLESLEGSLDESSDSAKAHCRRFVKTRYENSFGIDLNTLSLIDASKSKEYDPMWKCHDGRHAWEGIVEIWGEILISAKCFELSQLAKLAASEIGGVIASLLWKGVYGAPKIVSDGLLRLHEGKRFSQRSGKKKSDDTESIYWAFIVLEHEMQFDGLRPSQDDVRARLKAEGKCLGRDRISKAFDYYGLKERSCDARTAVSRIRKKS